MSQKEIKAQIHSLLEDLSEDSLQEVLALVKKLKQEAQQEIPLDAYFEDIVAENDNLLRRLAQ